MIPSVFSPNLQRSLQTHSGPSRIKVTPQNPFVQVSEEIRDAISKFTPVVALESTIYTHGAS